MNKLEVIANRQLAEMLFMMRTTIVISFAPVLTTGSARQDAWAAAIIGGVAFIGIAWAIARLGMSYHRLTVVDYSKRLLGPVVGTAVSLAFVWIYLMIGATDLRVFGELVKAAFIPNTPIMLVIVAMAATFTVVAALGLESIARMADMLFPVFLAFVVLTLAGAMGHSDLRNLQPMLASGAKPVISSTWTLVGISAQWAVVSMLVPSLTQPERAASASMLAAATTTIVAALAVAVIVGVLGPGLGSESLFPFLKMARSINLTQLLQRMEALGVAAWGFGLAVTGSTTIYCGSKAVAQILGLPDHRKIVPFFGAALIAYAKFAYRDVSALLSFFNPPGFLVKMGALVGVPYLLIWGAHLIEAVRTRAARG